MLSRFNDRVKTAMVEQGLVSFKVIEEEVTTQPEPASPEAQKLFREARIYYAQADALDVQAGIVHGNKRRMKLYREAQVSRDLGDRYTEEGEAIAHYGRKGMKWGIRRSKKELASTPKTKETSTKKLKKKASKMSDEELQASVRRLNLEKQYVTLTKQANAKTKTRMQRGREEMASIAKASAKKAIQKQTTNLMSEALEASVKKARSRGS
jgi:hypothetical protein